MADRVSAAIRIGGVLSPACLANLVAAITADDARTDWEGEAFTSDAIEPDTPLYLVAHEVAWGTSLRRSGRYSGADV